MKRTFQTTGILLALLLGSPNAWSWESGNLRLRGRLQTRFEVKEKDENDGGGWESEFRLRRARVDGRWEPADWARLVLEFEGAARTDLNTYEFSSVELKDAFGRVKVHPALVFHLGRFKKPFSRLKLDSPFDLVVPSRGLLNRYAVAHTSHGGYGGRDIGVMLSGRLKKLARLTYYLGVFSGSGHIDGDEESHKDIVARIQVRPFKGCRLALNASHKLYHNDNTVLLTANLFGADARMKFGDFALQLEGAYGDNVDAPDDLVNHRLWGAHGIASYALRIGDELVLTPAFMVEVFDPSDQDEGGRALRLAGGLNLDIGNLMRVVLFAEGLVSGETVAKTQHDNGDWRDWNEFVSTRIMVQVNMVF
jgi:hypothetical protein